jgi:hypothetical protein
LNYFEEIDNDLNKKKKNERLQEEDQNSENDIAHNET